MGGWVKKFEYRDSIILAVRRTEYYNSATMALSKCMTDIQAEMKSRIEDECRKQMETLLEDTFSKKWEEYTNKTVATVNVSSLYTEGYGRLDLTAIPNNGGWGSYPATKTVLSKQQTMFEFSSKNVYFIHCCVSLTFSNSSWRMKGYFIDNYGFYHMTQGDATSAYPATPVKIDVMNPVNGNQYVYPLSDALIDNVKALPFVGSNPNSATNDVELESLIKVLPSIRTTASIFYNQAISLNALQKESANLTEQLAASDDLKRELVSLLNTLQQDYDALQEREKMTCDSLEQTTHALAEKTAEVDALQQENAMLREELRLKSLSLEESLARETERQALQEQAEAEAEAVEAEVKEEVEPSKENVKEEDKEEEEEEYEPQSWRWWSN